MISHINTGIGEAVGGNVCVQDRKGNHQACRRYSAMVERLRHTQRVLLALGGSMRVIVDKAEDMSFDVSDTERIQQCASDIYAVADIAVILLDALEDPPLWMTEIAD